jgi:hypothetical protein
MFDYSTKIYKQALIVLDSSFGALELPPALIPGSYFGSGYSKVALYEPSLMDSMNTTMDMESQITRTIFSGAPVLWNSDLSQGYQELGEALGEITELDEDDDWRIDPPVYNAARYVASELMRMSFPAPRIFNHGPKSIVFNWSSGTNNLYLTISGDLMSALISSPERIQRRIDYAANQLIDSPLALFYIEAAYSGKPVERWVTGAISDLQELSA